MHGEDRPNIKTQLIIVALKFAELPDHISIDYVQINPAWRTVFISYRMQMIFTPVSCRRKAN